MQDCFSFTRMDSNTLKTDEYKPRVSLEVAALLQCYLKWSMASEDHARGSREETS